MEDIGLRIGLEVHVRIDSRRKLFSLARNDVLGSPNSRVDFFDLGIPGSMPNLNLKALFMALRFVKHWGLNESRQITFDRKHYRYVDLPLGYQLTQSENPLVRNQRIYVEELGRWIGIRQVHLEMDAAKTVRGEGKSWEIDYNRCGCPLIEIVTEPELFRVDEIGVFLRSIRQSCLVQRISKVDLSKGDMRFDINVSIEGSKRQEIKNMNSFKFGERAVAELVRRLREEPSIDSSTWEWNEASNHITTTRTKELGADYYCLREYDLPLIKTRNLPLKNIMLRANEFKRRWSKLNSILKNVHKVEKIFTSDRFTQLFDFEGDELVFKNLAKLLALEPSVDSNLLDRISNLDVDIRERELVDFLRSGGTIGAINQVNEPIGEEDWQAFLQEELDTWNRFRKGETRLRNYILGFFVKRGFKVEDIDRYLRLKLDNDGAYS